MALTREKAVKADSGAAAVEKSGKGGAVGQKKNTSGEILTLSHNEGRTIDSPLGKGGGQASPPIMHQIDGHTSRECKGNVAESCHK